MGQSRKFVRPCRTASSLALLISALLLAVACTGSDDDSAAELVQQLIDDDEIDFLLGPYSSGLTGPASAVAEANGIEVLAVEAYPEGVVDVSDLVERLGELNPDVFIGGGHYSDAVLFLQSAQELGVRPDAMLITVGPSNPQLIDDLGASVNGVLRPTQWEPAMAYDGSYFGSAADYADYYESVWGERPVYQAASSTAAALALHLAIEAAGSLDTDDVREALRELDVETFYGPIRFDDRGVNVAKPMGTVQVQDGQIVVVAPTGAATGELVYPAR
ncbi:ABC transporter substrate-binding protein [Candidatus Poriferisodalis sp.]|uniref:ABC transporter substrate-binding protein n=1 Tax=Candidatus Poriferisodalis sp. TaxID=3101277 RepID=UPI003B014679